MGTLRIFSQLFHSASQGLFDVHNSLGYRVAEIERHLHSNERWFGLAAVPNLPTHAADRMEQGVSPFQIDAGNSDWGAWVQVLGSTDTPVDGTNPYFDPHRILITGVERSNAVHVIQFGYGATGAAALAAGAYTELAYRPQTAAAMEWVGQLRSCRVDAGTLGWARCVAMGQNTGTVNFYYGLHEYEG